MPMPTNAHLHHLCRTAQEQRPPSQGFLDALEASRVQWKEVPLLYVLRKDLELHKGICRTPGCPCQPDAGFTLEQWLIVLAAGICGFLLSVTFF